MKDEPDSLTGSAFRGVGILMACASLLFTALKQMSLPACFSTLGGAALLYAIGEIICLLKLIAYKLGSQVKPAVTIPQDAVKAKSAETSAMKNPTTYNLD